MEDDIQNQLFCFVGHPVSTADDQDEKSKKLIPANFLFVH